MKILTQASLAEACTTDESLCAAAKRVSEDLTKTKAYDIGEFVDQLGFALTSTSVADRVNGTCLLSAVLGQLPPDYLNEQQLQFLSTFYADRLKDNHNVVPPVIDGIAALVHMPHLPHSSAAELLRSFFTNTTCQSQVRSDRVKLFAIFKYMAEEYTKELKAMGGDFLYGLINSIDGERDPRNLEYIFNFMPALIARFPLLHLAEEMFEIFACYFPIDFNPNKSDPDTITRDQLAHSLAQCLAATPDFAEWAVPLALEKLESDLQLAKLDALELLTQMALKFPPRSLEPHFDQIWTALRAQLLPGGEQGAVVQAALQTLRSLLEQAAAEPELSHNAQTQVLGQVLPHLAEPTHRLFEPSTAVALVCVSGDPPFAGEKILNSFLITLRALGGDNDDAAANAQRVKIFTILSRVFKIVAMRCDGHLESIASPVCQELQTLIIATLRHAIVLAGPADLVRATLSVLNESTPLIAESSRVLLYQALVQLITHETLDLEFTQLLEQLGALQPIELQSNCIDVCIRQFDGYTHFVQRKVLRHLQPLVKQMAFAQRVLDLIMQHVFGVGAGAVPVEVRLLALEALNELLVSEDHRFVEELQHNACLIDQLVKLAQQQEQEPSTGTADYRVLEQIAAALSRTVQVLPIAEQYAIVTEFLPQLNLQLAADLFVAKGLLGYLHKDISLDDHFERLLTDLTALALHSDNAQLRLVAHHLLASLVNKIEQSPTNRGHLARLLQHLKEEVRRDSVRAVETLAWLAKGLSVRGADEAADILEALAALLDHPTLGTAASLAFEVIAAECPQLHLPVLKYLFKQKLFHTVLAKLRDGLERYADHHLNAFVYVLQATPHAVLRLHIAHVAPTLFKCLEKKAGQPRTLCIALEICERFVQQQDEYFRTHLQHLIPSCLQLATSRESMKVRVSSLQLLADITRYPAFVLLPHKMDVVLGLAAPLDDAKRLVRTAAVKASNAWFLVGTAGGENVA